MAKPRNAERFTAWSTGTGGARPAAGRKPANASWTEPRKSERKRRRRRTSPGVSFVLRAEIFCYTLSTFARSVVCSCVFCGRWFCR